MDQSSIVLCLHLNGLSDHAIHDDLVATLGPKAMANSMVTRYLRKAKPGTAEVTLDPESRSSHFDNSDRLARQHWTKRKAEPFISHALLSIEGSQNRSGSYDVFFAGCRISCQTLER
jgi:hypothetical protein